MNRANVINTQANLEVAIISLRGAIGDEEDRIERFASKMQHVDFVSDSDRYEMYERALARHEARLAQYQVLMVAKMKESEGTIVVQPAVEVAQV